ncbi:hypothetical protein JCM17380_16990 [Desulfosporosinus burensis]
MYQNQIENNETAAARFERLIQKEKEYTAGVRNAEGFYDFFEQLFKNKYDRIDSESESEA